MTTYTQALPEHFLMDAMARVTNPERDYPYGAAKFMARHFGEEIVKVSDSAPKPSNVVKFKPQSRLAA